jgi:hypothetical protein
MKKSVKFFLGGIVAATLIFGALAFTTKQTENKEYVMVRVVETAEGMFAKPVIQICDNIGQLEIRNVLVKGKYNGIDSDGKNTIQITKLINEFSAKGYKVSSLNNSFGTAHLVTTIIFEK